jgi:mono/diheme cytochrome c family protein
MPASITMALLARGQERFDIDCAPCHGRAGDGHGMIVERGFPQPPDLASPELRRAKAADLYDVITNGHGVMYGYASRMASPDRWAVIAYIRALQLGRDALVAALPAADRDRLAQTP